MLGDVNKGKYAVSIALLTVVVLPATDVGRERETGTGAVWVARGLVANPSVQTCSQLAGHRQDLVFEMLDPRDIDTDLPRLLATGAREVVDFEWNEATGELSFSTTASSAVFSDLQYPTSQASAIRRLNCG
jgi:hypothetical protein